MFFEKYMLRCIQLAKNARSEVMPNPLVGAVIVFEEKIIGEGYHNSYGGNHAEVEAINSVQDKTLLKYSTIYVNLEPCSHFGKTPPCSDLIIKHGFKKVVIGSRDPHHLVNGNGVQKLIHAGIEVEFSELSKQCEELNKRFFCFHRNKRPYVILKWAQTTDGFIDKIRNPNEIKQINWISSPETKTLVHQWRSEEHAILVGKNTIIQDDPSLTVRNIKGKNPIRIILDSNLELEKTYQIFDGLSETIILNLIKEGLENKIRYIKLEALSPEKILNSLYKLSILSVFIEGGEKTLTSFLENNLWDEARIIQNNNNEFNKGLEAPKINLIPTKVEKFSNDTIFTYFRK